MPRLWYGVHLHARQYMGVGCLSKDEIGPEGMMRGDDRVRFPIEKSTGSSWRVGREVMTTDR